ncbi:hypothetical protein DFH27DRAFT_529429 [Peziza echinospora]|nr:hypothetical protein DFH27DRAFT_529429 [Peziza echinospora]
MPSIRSISPSFLPLLAIAQCLLLPEVAAHPAERSCSCMNPAQQRCGDASHNLCCSQNYDCVYLKPFYHVCYNSDTGDWIMPDGSRGKMPLSLTHGHTHTQMPEATREAELKARNPAEEGNVYHDRFTRYGITETEDHQHDTRSPCTCHGYITITHSIDHPLETQHETKTQSHDLPVESQQESHPVPTDEPHETKTKAYSGKMPEGTHEASSLDVPHSTPGTDHELEGPTKTSKTEVIHVPGQTLTPVPHIPTPLPHISSSEPAPVTEPETTTTEDAPSHVPSSTSADGHYTTVEIESTLYTFTKPMSTSVTNQTSSPTSSTTTTPSTTTSRQLNATNTPTPEPVGAAGTTMVPVGMLLCIVFTAVFLLA